MSLKEENHNELGLGAPAKPKKKRAKKRAANAQPQANNQTIPKPNIVLSRLPQHSTIMIDDKSKPFDFTSILGQFGWGHIGDTYVPYLIRSEEKYCAVRMIETTTFKKYFSIFHQDLLTCTDVPDFPLTLREAILFNEINVHHSDSFFGLENFTKNDTIVRLSDAVELYNFLQYCHSKYVNLPTTIIRNGFVKLNNESVIPYTISNGEKYVPMFCFEGEIQILATNVIELKGWDLAYLKFCCLLQGIRKTIFNGDSCSVIRLDTVKEYFPENTIFIECWPQENFRSDLLSFDRKKFRIRQWTKRMPTPIVENKPKNIGGDCGLMTAGHTNKTDKSETVKKHNSINDEENNSFKMPDLVRISDFIVSGGNISSNYVNIKPKVSAQDCSMTPQPLTSMSTPLSGQDIRNIPSFHQDVIQQATMNNTECNMSSPSSLEPNFIQIPDEPLWNPQIMAYQIMQIWVEGKMLYGINARPYIHTDLLVPVCDICSRLFNNVSLNSCLKTLQTLGVQIFRLNNSQWRQWNIMLCSNHGVTRGIAIDFSVYLRHLLDFMPQLKYILNRTFVGMGIPGELNYLSGPNQ